MFRNYFEGRPVDVFDGNRRIVNALPFRESLAVQGFPLKRTSLLLRTLLPSGVMAESGVEEDFDKASRATLLIIPDTYNRFRPRIVLDGKNF
jgi:hypothetical protein